MIERGIRSILIKYLEQGGDLYMLERHFVNEVDQLDLRVGERWDYVPLALALVKAGVPIDLTALAYTISSPSFLKKKAVYGHRRCVMDMVALLDAGAAIDLDSLFQKVKKAKSAQLISYDEYLEIMRDLFEAGLDEDCQKFAQTVLRDLSKTKASIRHTELIKLLAEKGVDPEIIQDLRKKIGPRY